MSNNTNTKVGVDALKNNSSNNNTAFGYTALKTNSDGTQNTSSGSQSLEKNETGINNTAVGYRTLKNTLGIKNTALGSFAGRTIEEGNQNTCIGFQADVSDKTATNQIVIGNEATGHQDNGVVIGNTNINVIEPGKNNQVDLGSSNYKFKSLNLSNQANISGNINLGGKIGFMNTPSLTLTIDAADQDWVIDSVNNSNASLNIVNPSNYNANSIRINNSQLTSKSIVIFNGYQGLRINLGFVTFTLYTSIFFDIFDGYMILKNPSNTSTEEINIPSQTINFAILN